MTEESQSEKNALREILPHLQKVGLFAQNPVSNININTVRIISHR